MKLPHFSFGKKSSGGQKINIPTEETDYGFSKIKEIIAPPGALFNSQDFQVGEVYGKNILILAYPKFLFAGWLEKILEIQEAFNLSLFAIPMDVPTVLKTLEKQLARVEAQIEEREERGLVRSPELGTAYEDIETLRDSLVQAREKMMQVGLYMTVYNESKEEISIQEKEMVKMLESSLILAKPVIFQQEDAFISTLPLGLDKMESHYQMNSSPASSFFPFISSELSTDNGTLLGINLQDNSLVIFDRFAFENAHMVTFARSGAGKSYTSKIEMMRNLMMGIDVIALDPENEYRSIAEIYGGSFIPVSLKSEFHLNPFDLPPPLKDEEPIELFKEKVADVLGLIELLIGEKLPSDQLVIFDRAINQTYASFNILPESDFSKVELFPTLNDFAKVLRGVEGGDALAEKLYPFTEGSFNGFINQQSNVELNKRIVVFGFRDLVEELRPIGMYIVLNYVMNRIRKEVKRRIVVLDEAWWLMKQEAAAMFLLNSIKRGRKYMLGISSITQDVEDFLNSPYGKPIITNSGLVFLMKQSPATIDLVGQVFALSDGEKKFLLQAERGRGILIAGLKRVPLFVLASYAEDQIIRSTPEQLLLLQQSEKNAENTPSSS
ncbi:MAG: Type IV secretory pathway VirB4 protein-like protein [Parcubacteria group bacterium GW2011_GWC1_41_7]|nr:MAG: Type IV secretory pathway VirB4 protein-like protein [Parcubacteria group bacterium GW2011_GWC1_41_7]